MDYTDKERQVLSLMQRTDFKNLSKNDIMLSRRLEAPVPCSLFYPKSVS